MASTNDLLHVGDVRVKVEFWPPSRSRTCPKRQPG